MKTYKIISVLLVFVILLSVCGCDDTQTEQSKSEQSETESAPEYSSVPETPIEDFEIGINEDGEAELTHYFGGDETVRIPAYFEGKPIGVIHMYAFLNNHKVKTIIFPETARRVRGTGFDRSCDSVERIVKRGTGGDRSGGVSLVQLA